METIRVLNGISVMHIIEFGHWEGNDMHFDDGGKSLRYARSQLSNHNSKVIRSVEVRDPSKPNEFRMRLTIIPEFCVVLVRTPGISVEQMENFLKYCIELVHELGRHPTSEEISSWPRNMRGQVRDVIDFLEDGGELDYRVELNEPEEDSEPLISLELDK